MSATGIIHESFCPTPRRLRLDMISDNPDSPDGVSISADSITLETPSGPYTIGLGDIGRTKR